MSSQPPDRTLWNARLSTALRALRQHRHLRAQDIARAMDMPLRSYHHFEAGGGVISLERIFRFADATESDAYAILAEMLLGAGGLAVRCADNKMITALAMTVQEFDEDLGDNIARLETATFIRDFSLLFHDLGLRLRERDDSVRTWMQSRTPKDKPDD